MTLLSIAGSIGTISLGPLQELQLRTFEDYCGIFILDLVTVHRIVILFEQYLNPVVEFRDAAIPEKFLQGVLKTSFHLLVQLSTQTLLNALQVIENE